MNSNEIDYREYICSESWRRRRRAFLKKHPNCNRCPMTGEEHRSQFGSSIQVHHKSYARLGNEADDDLETLCRNCHQQEENFACEYDPTRDWTLDNDDIAVKLVLESSEEKRAVSIACDRPTAFDRMSNLESTEYWLEAQKLISHARRERGVSWERLEDLVWLERFVLSCKGLDTHPEEESCPQE